MNVTRYSSIPAGFALWLMTAATSFAQQDNQGIEVQARGPVHEAFAQPVVQRPGPSPIVPKQPPDAIPELPSAQKPEGDDAQWIPGYFAWDEERGDFLWVSGIWRVPPPNHYWTPGYWEQIDGGWRWVSGYWAATGQVSVELYPQPPEPVEEAVPPAPDANSLYIPGCWVHVEQRFWWRPGHWVVYQPGWVWIPACYSWTPAGYVFVNGHWDHDLHHRGVCFAPVFVEHRVVRRPGWHYRPFYAVAVDHVLSGLFVNIERRHYYFGDYYDGRYVRSGYVPWVDYRTARHYHDPLFRYYHWQHRGTPQWDQQLRAIYSDRREGKAPRPPRTVVSVQKQTEQRAVTMVTPLNQLKGPAIKLQPVTKTHLDQVQKTTNQRRTFSQQRAKIEMQHFKPSPKQIKEAPRQAPVRMDLPKTIVQPPQPIRKAPAQPPVPKVQFKEKVQFKDTFKEKEHPKKEHPKKEHPKKEHPKKGDSPDSTASWKIAWETEARITEASSYVPRVFAGRASDQRYVGSVACASG